MVKGIYNNWKQRFASMHDMWFVIIPQNIFYDNIMKYECYQLVTISMYKLLINNIHEVFYLNNNN